jgi:hypothetical protein
VTSTVTGLIQYAAAHGATWFSTSVAMSANAAYSKPVKINKAWHEAHVMPPNATLAQRVEWHIAHRENCACRPVPASLGEEVDRLSPPVPRS